MKKILFIFIFLFTLTSFGCGISEEAVDQKISKSKDELNAYLKKEIYAVNSNIQKINKEIKEIKTGYATKQGIDKELNKMKLELKNQFDEVLKTIKVLESKLSNIKMANKEEIKQVMLNVQSATNAYWKQLSQQKEAIARAMRELEKLAFPKMEDSATPEDKKTEEEPKK